MGDESARRVRTVWLRLVLGVVYLGMAIGQLVSWSAMPGILGAYRLLPGPALPALVVALIVGELVGGLWFVARPRSRAVAPVWIYAAVAGVWAVLGLQAYLRGLPVANCGCFGLYLTQRLSLFVLVQDALLLVYAVLLLRGVRSVVQQPAASEEAR
jgi:Methylamine utilisation protein MauE